LFGKKGYVVVVVVVVVPLQTLNPKGKEALDNNGL